MSTDIGDLSNQALILRNEGDSTFAGLYGGQMWRISPGESAVVQREAAVLWLGDPRLIDHEKGGRLVPARSDEVDRIKLRYGIPGIPFDPQTGKPMPTWEEAIPKLRVTNHQGEEIRMIIHDPEGDSVKVVNQTVEENRLLTEQMQRMEAELASMRQRFEAIPQREEGVQEVPEDTPQAASRRGRAS
jgi:hypothetical protein